MFAGQHRHRNAEAVNMRVPMVIFFVIFCGACSSPEHAQEVKLNVSPCENWHDEDMHCTVSIYSLITFPAKYDGTLISVKGYVSEGRYIVLFSDRESAEYSILENGFRLTSVEAHPQLARAARSGRYVRLTGKFTVNRQDEHALDGSQLLTAGALDVITVIAENEDAWGCLGANEMPLSERFVREDACHNLEVRKKLENR